MEPRQNVSTIHPNGNGVSAHERLLLDIIDTVREPLLVLDDEFRVTHANRGFLRTFQVAPEETIGELVFRLGDGQWDIPPLRRLLHERLDVESELNDVDVDHVFPGIGRKIMLLNVRRVTHDPNLPRIILVAIEDITERRLTERRLAARQLELTRSNAALKEFAFVASHDLQEPLRKILSFGERLMTTAGPELKGNSREYLVRMVGAASRMRTLVSDLLVYSQIATSAHSFAPTELAAVARDVVSDLEMAIAEAGARIDVGHLPVIEADATQMRQLFQNLLGNALKFRRKDVPPVVRVRSSRATNGLCMITVVDNGIGFRQAYGERIFRMYERLHARTTYDGSGIGLAICRRVVERHGGSIAATSSPGNGATFTVTLPFTRAQEEQLS